MKQIQECLNRYFNGQSPLKRKWQIDENTAAFQGEVNREVLCLYHYQHLVLVVDKSTYETYYTWWEVQADKRGLDSALEYFREKMK